MSQTIQWDSNVRVAGKTELAHSRTISVEAVDSIKVTVRGTVNGPDTDMQVDVVPAGGDVLFIAIVSDRYGDDVNFLSFKVNAAASLARRLDEPYVVAGAGLVEILDPAPASLFFSSTLAEDASVRVLVGRDATP